MTASSPVCFFGWGTLLDQCFDDLVHQIGVSPDYIVDNSPSKWGREFRGIKCVSPDYLSDLPNPVVYITIRNYESVVDQIGELAISLHACVFEKSAYKVKKIVPTSQLSVDRYICSIEPADLSNKVVMVTGASRGLGREIAKTYARFGASLLLHAKQTHHLDQVKEECEQLGVSVRLFAADLSNVIEIKELARKVQQERIDILYNNAAYSPPVGDGIYSIPIDDFRNTYVVNAIAPVILSNSILPEMLSNKFGRVVNLSTSIQFRPEVAAYAMSKSALDKYSTDMASTLKGTNVSIHLIDPGWMRTDMTGNTGPHSVESAINGILICALLGPEINGDWIIAQDYAGLSLLESVGKCRLLSKTISASI